MSARDMLAEHPALERSFADSDPTLASAAAAWKDGIPLPQSVAAFVAPPFFRPPGSHRAFYFYPRSEDGNCTGRGVLAIKGLEPCASDVAALFSELQQPCYTPHTMAEHLIFEEGKIPGCLGVWEAEREAQNAAALQLAHLEAYGGLARVPLPLLILRHDEETDARVERMLAESLSAAARQRVHQLLEGGLAAYVYYYPAPPVRARDVDRLLSGLDFRQRSLALVTRVCDPDVVVGRWVELFARMLYLGYAPGAPPSRHSGICCQPQNACIDGGFVDLDSLTPLADLPDDVAVAAALQLSTESLLQAVRALLAGSTADERGDARLIERYLTQYLAGRIAAALASEARPGLALDPRVVRCFTPAANFEQLVQRLSACHAAPSIFDESGRAFYDFGLALIRDARES